MTKRIKKNFIPTLSLAIFFWLSWGLIVWFIEPTTIKDLIIPSSYSLFFLSLGPALFFSLALICRHSRRGLSFSLAIILFLILRLLGLGNLLNLILILGSVIALEVYFAKR